MALNKPKKKKMFKNTVNFLIIHSDNTKLNIEKKTLICARLLFV